MAVTVTIHRGSSPLKDKYPTADTLFVKEGHLHVAIQGARGDEHVAIYAPGDWQLAAVDDEKK